MAGVQARWGCVQRTHALEAVDVNLLVLQRRQLARELAAPGLPAPGCTRPQEALHPREVTVIEAF